MAQKKQPAKGKNASRAIVDKPRRKWQTLSKNVC